MIRIFEVNQTKNLREWTCMHGPLRHTTIICLSRSSRLCKIWYFINDTLGHIYGLKSQYAPLNNPKIVLTSSRGNLGSTKKWLNNIKND